MLRYAPLIRALLMILYGIYATRRSSPLRCAAALARAQRYFGATARARASAGARYAPLSRDMRVLLQQHRALFMTGYRCRRCRRVRDMMPLHDMSAAAAMVMPICCLRAMRAPCAAYVHLQVSRHVMDTRGVIVYETFMLIYFIYTRTMRRCYAFVLRLLLRLRWILCCRCCCAT